MRRQFSAEIVLADPRPRSVVDADRVATRTVNHPVPMLRTELAELAIAPHPVVVDSVADLDVRLVDLDDVGVAAVAYANVDRGHRILRSGKTHDRTTDSVTPSRSLIFMNETLVCINVVRRYCLNSLPTTHFA